MSMDKALERYRTDNGLVDVQGLLVDEQQLRDLNDEATKANIAAAAAQASFDEIERLKGQPAAQLAASNSLSSTTADAIRDGRRPQGMSDDEALVYDVSIELHRTKNVSGDLYKRATARFGAQGVTDLIGTNGYYTLLAMQLNAHRMPLPDGAPGLPKLR